MLAIALAGGGPSAQLPDHAAAVEAILSGVDTRSSVQRERAVEELLLLGGDAVPALVAALESCPIGSGRSGNTTSARSELLLDTLARAPRAAVREHGLPGLQAGAGAAERVASLRLVGRLGDPRDLPTLLELTGEPAQSDPREVHALAEAIAALLRVEPSLARSVGTAAAAAEPPRQLPLLGALGRAPSRESLDALGRALVDVPERIDSVLAEIERAADALTPPFEGSLLVDVRWLLKDRSEARTTAAARALGALHDHASVPELIALLGRGEPVASAAHGALGRITGLSFRPDPRRWRAWHEGELAWWREDSTSVLSDLRASESEVVFTALTRVAEHRLFRDELAAAVAPLLLDREPSLRAAACRALGQIAAPSAADALTLTRDDPDPDVQEASAWALAALSNRSLGRTLTPGDSR
jgi:HEAT repeat protein